ncbi:MAG: FAD:protein FMN transferase, partial [Candidatus Competibacter sp.]|nr:FAD:protein FMN transferase [Candidatus Competibacter sp.]
MRRSPSRFLVSLLACLLLAACEQAPPDSTVGVTGSTMGTSYELKLVPKPEQTIPTAAIKTQADNLLARINKQMSTYDPDSELSRFNHSSST